MKKKVDCPNVHQRLVNRCIKGDRNAQFDIYKLYSKAMYNTCFRITADSSDAEDVMQEAFFKAFDKIKTYKNEVSFGAWLKRIMVNTAIDFMRKSKPTLVPIEDVHGLSIETESEEGIAPENVQQLKDAISKLPSGYQLVINLFYFEDYSHGEIAELLGITASTSRSQLARAKKRLTQLLTPLK
ncbi:MAG TPA: RNA polymerase sigma factor [Perlabentimonas sp.]|nr:RNA polymerase sigma factor [Perlabentimonas sp.]